MNLTPCDRLRRTNMYAKKTGRLQERLDVYWIVHNFVRVHFTTRQVPAVALGILEHGLGYVRSTCAFSQKASMSINNKWL